MSTERFIDFINRELIENKDVAESMILVDDDGNYCIFRNDTKVLGRFSNKTNKKYYRIKSNRDTNECILSDDVNRIVSIKTTKQVFHMKCELNKFIKHNELSNLMSWEFRRISLS